MAIKKYLAKFESTLAYDIFAASDDFVTPNVSAIYGSNTVFYNPYVPPHDYSQDYLTFEALESGTFAFTNAINYSIDDGETWKSLSANTNTPTLSAGDKIMFKATLTPTSSNGIGTFSSTGEFNVIGNVMSLLYEDNFIGQVDLTGKTLAFYKLFKNCTKLISAKNLSLLATTLVSTCYKEMFNGCTSLITPPVLPATTLKSSCYAAMFQDCTSLTTAPELPATILESYCYTQMFYGCTSLITIPEELPATTLANYCYQSMFSGCRSLTTTPELPATTLAERCYASMFAYCTSLTTAPELPITILATGCYAGMFQGCSSLTTAPELPATTLAEYCYNGMFFGCTTLTTAPKLQATTLPQYCYQEMFSGCTSLNSITMLATNISTVSRCLKNWVSGVSSSGTFTKAPSMTSLPSGVNGIPSGWTVQDYVAS